MVGSPLVAAMLPLHKSPWRTDGFTATPSNSCGRKGDGMLALGIGQCVIKMFHFVQLAGDGLKAFDGVLQ